MQENLQWELLGFVNTGWWTGSWKNIVTLFILTVFPQNFSSSLESMTSSETFTVLEIKNNMAK